MKECKKILKDNPGSIVFARYADHLLRGNDTKKALEVLRKGVEANPHYAAGHSLLSSALFSQGYEDEAAKELSIAVSLDPQMPADLFRLGQYHMKHKSAVKAAAYLWAARRYESDVEDVLKSFEEAESLRESQSDLQLSEQSERVLSDLEREEREKLPADAVPAEDMESLSGETARQAEEEIQGEGTAEGEVTEEISSFLEEEYEEIQPEAEEAVTTGQDEKDEAVSFEKEAIKSAEEAAETDIFAEKESEEKTPEGEHDEPAEISEEEFEALLEESEQETELTSESGTEDTEYTDIDDSVFEEELTVDISAFEDKQPETTEPEVVEDVEPEPTPEEEKSEPEVPVSELEVTVAEETVLGETAEPEAAGAAESLEEEDLSFRMEVAGIVGDEEPDAAVEPVGSGSGDQPKAVGVHDIDEDENYDPGSFSYGDSGSEDEEPVLTVEERMELLALESDEVLNESDFGDTESTTETETVEELPDTGSLTSGEEYDATEEEDDDKFISELTSEEINILSETDTGEEDSHNDLEDETIEGIDYSDILSGEEETTLTADRPVDDIDTETSSVGYDDSEATSEITEESEEMESSDNVSEEETDINENIVIQEVTESSEETEDEIPGEDIDQVEDMIKSAPDYGIRVDEEELPEEIDISLDVLITEYENTLEETEIPEVSAVADKYSAVPEEGIPSDESEDTAGENTGELTATMAEIYMAQGLLDQAIQIYETILRKQPDNRKARDRLEEIRDIRRREAGDS